MDTTTYNAILDGGEDVGVGLGGDEQGDLVDGGLEVAGVGGGGAQLAQLCLDAGVGGDVHVLGEA